MLCYKITYFFSCILPVVFPYYCKKSAVCKFIIALPAVDKCKSAPIVFHDCFGVIAAFDNIQDKELFRALRSKKRSTLMDCGESMTAT